VTGGSVAMAEVHRLYQMYNGSESPPAGLLQRRRILGKAAAANDLRGLTLLPAQRCSWQPSSPGIAWIESHCKSTRACW